MNSSSLTHFDRIAELRRFCSPETNGLEIAPWIKPIVAKSAGYNSLSLDVFDYERLVKIAKDSDLGWMVPAIERVDLFGSATDIDVVVRQKYPDLYFKYVVSSHNFEHLPNPIKFLKGCSRVMEEGGYLSMAIPDKRFCFDHFRPVSTTTDFIAAAFEDRSRPTAAQIFDQASMQSYLVEEGHCKTGFSQFDDPSLIEPDVDLETAFAKWRKALIEDDGEYTDCHCWTFTPSSFELIMRDLSFLGLIKFDIVEVKQSVENEFFVHMIYQKSSKKDPDFYARRKVLLQNSLNECAVNSTAVWFSEKTELPEEPELPRPKNRSFLARLRQKIVKS